MLVKNYRKIIGFYFFIGIWWKCEGQAISIAWPYLKEDNSSGNEKHQY